MTLAILTASTDPFSALDCISSWRRYAVTPIVIVGVVNGSAGFGPTIGDFDVTIHEDQYLGTVPAFERGMTHLLGWNEPPDVIACLHDDFRIDAPGWDEKVLNHFKRERECGLLGFGGAVGLGDSDIYKKPYDPMQLARIGFRSNLDDAESHGLRSMLPERVACLDGFSQVGRLEFWQGFSLRQAKIKPKLDHIARVLAEEAAASANEIFKGAYAGETTVDPSNRPWTVLKDLGFVHHFYDGALGCLAKRYGWDTWYLPLRGHHFGGRTAVGDAGYADWAQGQVDGGDQGFWTAAHRIGYDSFRDVLPIRL